MSELIDAPRIENIIPDQIGDGRPKNVCIVTSEFVGLSRNGGIGTAMSGLAELLTTAGHHVTVLYTRGHLLTAAACRVWSKRLAQHGIAFVPTRPSDFRNSAGQIVDLGFVVPAIVAKLLRERSFDVIHLSDSGGHGYLVASARYFGIGFAKTHVVTGLHGPTRWTTLLNETPTSPLLQIVEEAEEVTIGCSDIVWSPSRYLVEWMVSRKFRLPPGILLQQYVLPRSVLGSAGPPLEIADGLSRQGPIKTLIFFGRLELRKGLGLFLDFLDRNQEKIAAGGLDVVFMGRIGRLAGERADVVIRRRAEGWRFPWRIASALGQAEAVVFLRSAGKLAIIASPEDNSPCTVYEAVENKIPFIAAATGGIPEIIHPGDGSRVTFAYDEASLQSRLETVIHAGGGIPARPAVTREENTKRWLAFHAAPERWAPKQKDHLDGRSVGIICVVFAAGRLSDNSATVDQFLGLGPKLKALLVVCDNATKFKKGTLCVVPGDLNRTLARLVAEHFDAAVVFLRGGVTSTPSDLVRMIGHLRVGDVDGLIPAALASGKKIIWPLPFSARLRDIVDPMSTGLIAFSAAAVAASLKAIDYGQPQASPQIVGTLAANGALRILPYPEVIANLPSRLTTKLVQKNRAGKNLGWTAHAGKRDVLSRDYWTRQTRRFVSYALCSPVGGAVPYGFCIVQWFQNIARLLTAGTRSRSRRV